MEEGDPGKQRPDAEEPAPGDPPVGQAQQAVLVDGHAGQLLPGDGEGDGGGGANPGDEQERRGDVGRTDRATQPAPPRRG